MEPNWAADHLQVIRTLMERSALYRRALAPLMIFVGAVGVVAAAAGWGLGVSKPVSFVLYWYCVGALALAGGFLMVRRQAWQQAEPLWSPPTRRVAQAMLPPLSAGFLLGTMAILANTLTSRPAPLHETQQHNWYVLICLPVLWVVLYGCAVHAAGFFMRRGIRLFGWLLIITAWLPLFCPATGEQLMRVGHATMGLFFGALHLAYGVYLYFTEQHGNEV